MSDSESIETILIQPRTRRRGCSRLKDFEPNSMVPNPHINIIGNETDSFKSSRIGLVKKIMEGITKSEFNPNSLIISPDTDSHEEWQRILPGSNIISIFDDPDIAEILGFNPRVDKFVIFDCCFNGSFEGGPSNSPLMELFLNGRHYRITCVILNDNHVYFKPDLRLNFDYIFISRPSNENEKGKMELVDLTYDIWDKNLSMFQSLEEAQRITNPIFNCGNQTGLVVVDNRKVTDEIYEKIYRYSYV